MTTVIKTREVNSNSYILLAVSITLWVGGNLWLFGVMVSEKVPQSVMVTVFSTATLVGLTLLVWNVKKIFKVTKNFLEIDVTEKKYRINNEPWGEFEKLTRIGFDVKSTPDSLPSYSSYGTYVTLTFWLNETRMDLVDTLVAKKLTEDNFLGLTALVNHSSLPEGDKEKCHNWIKRCLIRKKQ